MKTVIIGGVAGGATAAARLRRLDEQAEIVILERSGYVSYANCGLPYYIGGVITDKRKLTLQTPESFRARFNIDVRVRHEALAIDRAAHEVLVRNLDTGQDYREGYDKLILSPGARPHRPSIPGMDTPRLFTLRTVEDTFAIRDFIDHEQPKRALVMGGGFIGLEMAENLRDQGLGVVLAQKGPQVMTPLDADMAALLHNELRRSGVDLRLNTHITSFAERGGMIVAGLAGGGEIEADMAVISVGVEPESHLAADAGLDLGLRGAVRTDAHMRTSDPDIYAVGDAVEVRHAVSGHPALIALAGPANKQGRIAADNICGIPSTITGSQGSSVLKLFGLTAASTGLNIRQATEAGFDIDAVVLSPASHATYYPGAGNMVLKVLFEHESGRILGAQAVGTQGVDKRIDVLAVAIRAKMTAADLTELDLAYAPPYSSAKDPVNMAGYMIENVRGGLVEQVGIEAVDTPGANEAVLDVRTPGERERGHVAGSIHIPLDELRERLDELPRDARLLVMCQSGLRSYLACRILTQNGFNCANVRGGYGFYQANTPNAVGPCGL